jgi:YidC/Oxa1 family membrane protein insertase
MNKLTLYIFPLGVLVFGFFFPIGLLIYWLANNTWTLMQQRLVYKRIDAEEEVKKTEAIEKRGNLAPKPGAKPDQAKKRTTAPAPGTKPPSDAKPAPNAKAAGTAKKPPNKPQPGAKPAPNAKAAGTARSKSTGTSKPSTGKPADNGAESKDGSTVSGLSSGRSRKKNTGRKNR